MVHAGVVPPQWDAAQTPRGQPHRSRAVQGPDLPALLQHMYGNEPSRWSDSLQGERTRCAVNALTRLRFCTPRAHGVRQAKDGATRPRRAPGPGSTFPRAVAPMCASPSATGPRWACSTALPCSGSTPAASGAAPLTAARIDGEAREIIQVPCKAPAARVISRPEAVPALRSRTRTRCPPRGGFPR